jgi:hypothetical protein
MAAWDQEARKTLVKLLPDFLEHYAGCSPRVIIQQALYAVNKISARKDKVRAVARLFELLTNRAFTYLLLEPAHLTMTLTKADEFDRGEWAWLNERAEALGQLTEAHYRSAGRFLNATLQYRSKVAAYQHAPYVLLATRRVFLADLADYIFERFAAVSGLL